MRHIVQALIGGLVLLGLCGVLYLEWPWYSALLAAPIGLFLNYWDDRLEASDRLRRSADTTANRKALSCEEFATEFFEPEHVPTAMQVVRAFEAIEGVDWRRVHADDQLIKDLAITEADVVFTLNELHQMLGIEMPVVPDLCSASLRAVVHSLCNPRAAQLFPRANAG